MTRLISCLIVFGCGLLAGEASAQLPYLQSQSFSNYGRTGGIGAVGRPTFSPYLNLLRSGNSTLFNYYGLVRPEIEFRATNQQFQSNFGRVDQQLRDTRREGAGSRLSESGHRVQFMSNLRGPGGSLLDAPGSAAGGYSQLGITGHSAWFGNTGVWYQPFGQTSGSSARGAASPSSAATGSFGPTGGTAAFSPGASLPSGPTGGGRR